MNFFEQSKARTFLDIVSLAFSGYRNALRRCIAVIVMIVVVKDFYIYLGGLPRAPTAQAIGVVIIALILVYLLAVAFYLCYASLKQSSVKLSDAFSHVLRRLASIYLALLMFFIIFAAIFFLVKALILLIGGHSTNHVRRMIEGFLLVGISGIVILFVIVRCYFVYPFVVIEKIMAWRAFTESIRLTMRNSLRTFGLYICSLPLGILTMPNTRHAVWLADHRLSALFDLIVFALLLPLYFNMVILMLKDLQWRRGS